MGAAVANRHATPQYARDRANLEAPAIVLSDAERAQLREEVIAAEVAEVREARIDIGTFARRYLPKVFRAPHGRFHCRIHRELRAMLHREEIDGAVRTEAAYAYPRGHGKTSHFTLAAVLYVLMEWEHLPFFDGRPPFIVLVGNNWRGPRDRALDIRETLERNEALRADYGDRVEGAPLWQQGDFITNDGCRVLAVGALGDVRGLTKLGVRPSLIILDDVENDQDVQNKDLREDLWRWITRALMPTGIEGEVLTWWVGTILHADACLARALDPAREPEWLKRRFAAQTNESNRPDPDGDRILWPEFWTGKRLARQRRKLGTRAYSQEFLNLPVDEASSLFPRAWLDRADRKGRGRPFAYGPLPRIPFDVITSTWDVAELVERAPDANAYQFVVTAWDLALIEDERQAQARDSDYFAAITLGLTISDRLDLRRVWRKRGMTPAQARARVISEFACVRPDVVIVENNQAQRYLVTDLRDQHPDVPIRGHTTDAKKHDVFEGVPMLSTLYELGRIEHSALTEAEIRAVAALTAELHGLGVEVHDDLAMALWMAALAVRKWQAYRDKVRRKRLGPPPPGYVYTFPERVAPGGYDPEAE